MLKDKNMLSNYQKQKSFEVKSICREDLTAFLSWEDIQRHFSDDWRMKQLADKLGDCLQENYWDSIKIILEDYFKLKLK
jgi:hypothetical protein